MDEVLGVDLSHLVVSTSWASRQHITEMNIMRELPNPVPKVIWFLVPTVVWYGQNALV